MYRVFIEVGDDRVFVSAHKTQAAARRAIDRMQSQRGANKGDYPRQPLPCSLWVAMDADNYGNRQYARCLFPAG